MNPVPGSNSAYYTKYDNKLSAAQNKTSEPKLVIKPANALAMMQQTTHTSTSSAAAAAAGRTGLTPYLSSMAVTKPNPVTTQGGFRFMLPSSTDKDLALIRDESLASSAETATRTATAAAAPFGNNSVASSTNTTQLSANRNYSTLSNSAAVHSTSLRVLASASGTATAAAPANSTFGASPFDFSFLSAAGSGAGSGGILQFNDVATSTAASATNPHQVIISTNHSEFTTEERDLDNPNYEIQAASLNKEDVVIAARAYSDRNEFYGIGLIACDDDFDASKLEGFLEQTYELDKTLYLLELEVYLTGETRIWKNLDKIIRGYRDGKSETGIPWFKELKVNLKFCDRGYESITIRSNGSVVVEKAD